MNEKERADATNNAFEMVNACKPCKQNCTKFGEYSVCEKHEMICKDSFLRMAAIKADWEKIENEMNTEKLTQIERQFNENGELPANDAEIRDAAIELRKISVMFEAYLNDGQRTNCVEFWERLYQFLKNKDTYERLLCKQS